MPRLRQAAFRQMANRVTVTVTPPPRVALRVQNLGFRLRSRVQNLDSEYILGPKALRPCRTGFQPFVPVGLVPGEFVRAGPFKS